jgi:hypothetical protein
VPSIILSEAKSDGLRLFSNLSPFPPSLNKGRGNKKREGGFAPSLKTLPSPLM